MRQMADIGDIGSDYEEKMRAHAIAQRKPTLPYIGVCHFCGASVKGLFCASLLDEDGNPDGCQQDYEKEHRR
jgi:hypothetical protein